MVLDLLLILELAWCSRWLRAAGARRALLRGAGLVAASYAGANLSGWLTRVLAPPAIPVLRWVEAELSPGAGAIPALSAYIPPEPAGLTGVFQVQWVAYNVTRSLLFAGITTAVFSLFVVMEYLSDALWDAIPFETPRRNRRICNLVALLSSAYLVGLTAMVCAQLAWLRPFSWGVPEVADSVMVRGAGWVLDQLR